MDRIQATNPYLRNGPSCGSFKSTVQLSLNRSPFKLPAVALIVAEVLGLKAYSPSRSHDYLIDLPSSEIRRSSLNRRKFAIRGRGRAFYIFCNTIEDADVWAAILSCTSSRRFNQHYRLGEKIADGRHSQIYLAYPHEGSSTAFVVKVNNRTAECNTFTNRSQFERDAHLKLVQDFDVTPRGRNMTEKKIDLDEREHREYKLKLFLDKIVTLRDSFGTPTEDFLVFEHQDGEILSNALATHGPLSEREARVVMWDLLTALHYIHEQGVVHRDVRASNVFYWREEDNTRAKLFDLSEARQIPNGISADEPFLDSPGDSHYKAFEILSGRYHGKPADIWSCGVLLYHMLTGTVPFQGENEQKLSGNIIEQLHEGSLFFAPIWDSLSPEAVSLIKQMLQPDPFKRPSALGARSHQWLSNALAVRKVDAKRVNPSQTLESEERSQASAACHRVQKVCPFDTRLLPAPLEAFGELDLCTLSESEGGLSPAVGASLTSDGTQKSTIPTVDDTVGKESEIGCNSSRSLNLKSTGSENPVLLNSLSSSVHVERYEQVAVNVETKLTSGYLLERKKPFLTIPSMSTNSPMIRSPSSCQSSHPNELQAIFRNLRDRSRGPIPQFSEVSRTSSLVGSIGNPLNADTSEAHISLKTATQSILKLIPLTRKFPDRERSGTEETFVTRQRLAHHCNHFCNARQCKRSRMRTTRVPQAKSSSTNQADRTACEKGTDKRSAPSDIMSTPKILDDDVNSWVKKTKFSSKCSLHHAPKDPLFQFKASGKAIKMASRSEDRIRLQTERSSTKPEIPQSNAFVSKRFVPLRDEMCTKTFVMDSVVAAAQIGLSEFSRSRPFAAKLLLRSPTAQLQLAMVLPYRRKFRIAGIALKAIFRIISLKKGTCLTRRVIRGQTLPTELWTLLTDIRRKCHMRPLRARMPKLFPADEFGGMMSKPRFEHPSNVETTPHRFWDRQREVRLGVIFRAWEVAKEKIVQLCASVGAGRRSDGDEGQDEESDRTARPGIVSYLRQKYHGFFRRGIEEEEEEEKYHHTVEMV